MKLTFLNKKKTHTRARRSRGEERSVLRTQILIGAAIVCVIGVLFTAVFYGTRVRSLQIVDVQVHGGFTIPHSHVRTVVQQELQGTYVKLVPKTFTWFYPKTSIQKRLEKIPRLKQSEMTLEGQELVVVFDEYQPQSLFCNEDQQCFFVDHTGFAFAKAPSLTGSAFIRYTEKGKQVGVKTQAVEPDFMDETQAFSEKLAAELDLYVTHIQILDALDVLYTVSGGGTIKVSQRMSLNDTYNNLQTLLQSEAFMHLESGAFQYIDLRFGDKLFVNEVTEEEKTASSSERAVE